MKKVEERRFEKSYLIERLTISLKQSHLLAREEKEMYSLSKTRDLENKKS